MNYAVITENDESKWEDQTGVLYHFPARYKNILISGTSIVYYKGNIKDTKYLPNRLSKKPHYFGTAKIGEVYVDPNNRNQYYAQIVEYLPFNEAISFKDNNEYLEVVNKSNYWRDGVRKITEDIYIKIIGFANFGIERSIKTGCEAIINDENLPNINDVKPKLSSNLFEKTKEKNNPHNNNNSSGGFSRNAKKIGDRAELVVLKYLKENNMSQIRWVANEGEKPGYDISCLNSDGEEIFIEVKGTTTSVFKEFIITTNELITSKRLGGEFYIYFVTKCLSVQPNIQIVQNPYERINLSEWKLHPLSYKISFS